MKTISVREMKAHWAEVEMRVKDGETFEVLNRGKPTARIVPAKGRPVLKWDNHLSTAVKSSGPSASDAVLKDRDGRW